VAHVMLTIRIEMMLTICINIWPCKMDWGCQLHLQAWTGAYAALWGST
jgi:hypothetical protein